jgi:hypothetical protein
MMLASDKREVGMFVDGDLSYAGISVVTVLSAGIGAYIGAYLKKKGENLATHEDFQRVLTELKETTRPKRRLKTRSPTPFGTARSGGK